MDRGYDYLKNNTYLLMRVYYSKS